VCSHRARHGHFSPAEITDDETWDSDLDGPDSCDSDLDSDDEAFYGHHRHRGRYHHEEDEDEFERDPWNAVCVLGLRVYSKDTDVTIEVHNGEGGRKRTETDDGSSVISMPFVKKETVLDVDDSAADATSPLRKRGNLDSMLMDKALLLGDAPAGQERNRQGTLS
jgi:hypothetical protein